MRQPHVFAAAFVAVMILAGCATSDYGRITDKIAAYEEQAMTARDRLKTAKSQSKITLYRTLISLCNKQLDIARRINPESNPSYKSGSITLDQAKAEKAERVAKLEKHLEQTMKERDGLVLEIETPATPASATTPATAATPAAPTAPATPTPPATPAQPTRK